MDNGIIYNVKIGKGIARWGTAWRNSLDFLGYDEAMTDLAKGYRYYISKFVPKNTGALRKTATVAIGSNHGLSGAGGGGQGNAFVRWTPTATTKAYFHYQLVGDVYGPNKAVFNEAGEHVGWRSPKAPGGKYNTHRKMGNPGSYTLRDGRTVYIKGYTTPNTRYDWIDAFAKDKGNFGETAVNIKAARYIYDAFYIRAKKLGLVTEDRHYGGYSAYRSWRQIVNRSI